MRDFIERMTVGQATAIAVSAAGLLAIVFARNDMGIVIGEAIAGVGLVLVFVQVTKPIEAGK